MTYQLYYDNTGSVADAICRHNDDGSSSYIPNCADNSDWQAYQVWVALGNTPDAAE